jgi:hypothetical protein
MSVQSAKAPFIEYTSIALVAQVSATTATSLTKVLPAGLWLITGSANVTGTMTDVTILTDIRTIFKETATTTAIQAPVSFLFASDGVTALRIRISATTSAGTWASASTIYDCYKIN